MSSENREIEEAINEKLWGMGINRPERFIKVIMERVIEDADDEWNDFDINIAIANELNELIERCYP